MLALGLRTELRALALVPILDVSRGVRVQVAENAGEALRKAAQRRAQEEHEYALLRTALMRVHSMRVVFRTADSVTEAASALSYAGSGGGTGATEEVEGDLGGADQSSPLDKLRVRSRLLWELTRLVRCRAHAICRCFGLLTAAS